MTTTITCPNCNHQFEPSAAMEQSIREKFRTEFNQKWVEQKKKQDEEIRLREEALRRQQEALENAQRHQDEDVKKQVEEERRRLEAEITRDLSTRLQTDFEARFKALSEANDEKTEQLKAAREKEITFLRKEREMETLKADLELKAERKVLEERQKMADALRRELEEKNRLRDEEHFMKVKELEKQLEDQRRLTEEMKRKQEQGSMQLQGEVQELALEELLKAAFPFDVVNEVPKGIRGADCILTVRNALGQECGCIIFESKRTQTFGPDWIDKLKNDLVTCSADIAVIVSQVLPKDMDRFGEKQGVYICTFSEVRSLVGVLRQAILRIFEARKSQENKGDKMVMLYDYLTGSEFMGQWNAMRESFRNFRDALQKERDDFEKNWKKKQKLLEVIINNSMQISGSIEGISGMEAMNWTALPGDSSNHLIE